MKKRTGGMKSLNHYHYVPTDKTKGEIRTPGKGGKELTLIPLTCGHYVRKSTSGNRKGLNKVQHCPSCFKTKGPDATAYLAVIGRPRTKKYTEAVEDEISNTSLYNKVHAVEIYVLGLSTRLASLEDKLDAYAQNVSELADRIFRLVDHATTPPRIPVEGEEAFRNGAKP